jgi:4-azaleucine resistance transporter AzlC
LPIGFAYGVLAQNNGLNVFNTLGMSVLVFAGSAQLIAVGLFAAGSAGAAIIATTFIVNLRHLLMSAALAPHIKHWTKLEQSVFAFELTDETFALHAASMAGKRPLKTESFAVNAIAQGAWVLGTLTGVMASGLIDDVQPIGLDYALPAMFIALLVAQTDSAAKVLTAIVAGTLSVGLVLVDLKQINVILATILAASLGLGVEIWIKKRSC